MIELRTLGSPPELAGQNAVIMTDGDGQAVRIVGRIDTRTSTAVRTALHDALEAGEGELLVHLAEAEVWDAIGLGVIVGAHHYAERYGRRLVLADVSPRLHRLIRRTRLSRLLTVAAPGALARHAA